MTIFIKNDDTVIKNYSGQDINIDEYYEIQAHELIEWANNSVLLADIGAATAVVAKDDSGSNDITDINDAINYLKGTSNPPLDVDGVPLSRSKITKTGWHFQMHGLEFCTSKIDSLYNKDVYGTDLGFTDVKYYDSADVELIAGTQTELDSNCTKTVVNWEADFDFEIIGGIVEQTSSPTSDVRIWVVAVPDLTVAQGGSVPFTQGGVNLRYLSRNIDLDGKTPKLMNYDAAYHTNKFRIIVKHDAGVICPIHMLFKLFKANI